MGMKKMLCPQCKVGIFCVKDAQGNRLPVYVSGEGGDCAQGRDGVVGGL